MSATIFIATAETDSIHFVLRGDAPADRIKQAITDIKSTVNAEQTLIFDVTVRPVISDGTRMQSVDVTVDKPHKPTLFAFLVSKLRRVLPGAYIGQHGDDAVRLSDANGVAHLVQRILREHHQAFAAAEEPARSFADVLEHLIQSLQAKHKRVGFKLTDTTSGLIASPRMRGPHELEDTLVLRDAESAHAAWVRVNTKTGEIVLDIDGRWHKVPAPVSVTSKSALVALINVYKATIARMA